MVYRPAEELYDINADPFYLENLIDREELSGVKNRLSQELRASIETLKGLFPFRLSAGLDNPGLLSEPPTFFDPVLWRSRNSRQR